MISLPAITICIRKNLLLKEEHFSHFSLNDLKKRSIEYDIIDEYLNNLTVEQQFNAIYSAKEVFNNSCQVMKPISFKIPDFYINCELISPIKQSIDYIQSCFAFFTQINKEPNDRYFIDHDVSTKNYWSEMLKITIGLNISVIHLYLHSRYEMITDLNDDRFERITLNPNQISYTKYHVTNVQLMPKPYKTSCVDYTQFGHRSKSDCILKCRIKYFRDHYRGWPGDYLTEQSSDEYMFDITIFEILKKNGSLNLMLGRSCRKFCGFSNDCFKQYFSFKTSIDQNFDQLNSILYIYPPDLPTLIFTHSPKIEIEEFICFIASIVSLWFGFSVMMLPNVCSLIFTSFINIINKHKTKVNISVTNIYPIKELEMHKKIRD